MLSKNKIHEGECLDLMKTIPDGTIDMILCDLPYGTTACKWDAVIPFRPLWDQYRRIAKRNAAIVLFSAQPFTTDLINSNRREFRYEMIWRKTIKSGFLNARKMPLREHENICVFYRALPTYVPQMRRVSPTPTRKHFRSARRAVSCKQYRCIEMTPYVDTGMRYPTDILEFPNPNHGSLHPTQKPTALYEYLINTFSLPGETVLDNCSGSGTIGEACINTGRDFIAIEQDHDFCVKSNNRIAAVLAELERNQQ